MKIAVVGTSNVGGGHERWWERAGHQVTRLGGDGHDVSDADVVLVAVPADAIADAFARLQAVESKTVMDATNLYGVAPPYGFGSNAEFVKSQTNRPTAKSFTVNAALLHPRLGEPRATPSDLWSRDDEAREVVEQLNRDVGCDPVRVGGLEQAAAPARAVEPIFAIGDSGLGPFLSRMAPPERF